MPNSCSEGLDTLFFCLCTAQAQACTIPAGTRTHTRMERWLTVSKTKEEGSGEMLQTLKTRATLMENLNLIQLQGILSPLASRDACTHMQIPPHTHTQNTYPIKNKT